MQKEIRKTLRFELDEWQKVEKKLDDNNLNFSTFARSAILKKKITLPIQKSLLYEINKIGNNLNQIAKAVNQKKDIDTLKMLVKIEKKLNELI